MKDSDNGKTPGETVGTIELKQATAAIFVGSVTLVRLITTGIIKRPFNIVNKIIRSTVNDDTEDAVEETESSDDEYKDDKIFIMVGSCLFLHELWAIIYL